MAWWSVGGASDGRGCSATWSDAFDGRPIRPAPPLGEVAPVLRRHAELLAELRGEAAGLRDLRKHTGWYLTGYPVGGEARRRLSRVASLTELDAALSGLDPTLVADPTVVDGPRGTRSGPQRVTVPEGWADDRDDLAPPPDPVLAVSGG